MTTNQVPVVDEGNQLLAVRPAQMTTKVIQTPVGQRLVLTIRTETTTLTVMLHKEDAGTWHRLLGAEIVTMGDVIAAPGPLPAGFKMPLDRIGSNGHGAAPPG